MKLNSVWWLLSTIGLGVIASVNAGGCGTDGTQNTGGSGGSESSSSSSSSSGKPADKGLWLGASCANATDCAKEGAPADSGAKCLDAKTSVPAFSGAPAGGYCSKECTQLSDCPGVGNLCYNATPGKPGVCVLGCEAGPAFTSLQSPLDSFKCHGRDDVFCAEADPTARACLPGCGSDIYCEDGSFCDPRSNTCKPMVSMGEKMGTFCDAKNLVCAGTCLITSKDGPGLCSQRCVMGGDFQNDCGAGFEDGLCILSTTGEGIGDAGFCAPACSDHGKCIVGGMFCVDLGAPNGFCVPGLTTCVTQAECDTAITAMDLPAGYKCTDTTAGKFCLEPKYPLGDLTPMMDGGVPDGGDPDAGGTDAGASDAGASDAGADSGDGG